MGDPGQEAQPDLTLDVSVLDPSTVLVRLRGGLDVEGAAKLKQSLNSLEHADQPFVTVDLAEVDFVDSTGLSVLIGFQRRLRPPRRLALANVSPVFARLLQYTGIDDQFEIVTTDESASLEAPPAPEQDIEAGGVEAHAVLTSPQPVPPASLAADDPRLSGDAATVLGIAGTALSFAPEVEDQAERWLRLLRHHGDSGVLLGSLGISDEPTQPESHGPRSELLGDAATKTDPVALVIGQARSISRSRGADTTHTNDVLQAVREIYGSAFEDVLVRHASEPEVVVEQLDQLLARR